MKKKKKSFLELWKKLLQKNFHVEILDYTCDLEK